MIAAEDAYIQAAVSAGSPPSPFSLLSGLGMYASGSVYWGSSATNLAGGTFDTRLTRSAAGVIEASTTTANNGLGTFKGGYAPVNLDVSPAAPTFTSGACVGSISGTPNGTAAFAISTGTGTCTSAFTVGMQTATTGWLCNAWDPANAGTAEKTRETTVSTTAPVFTNYSIGTHPAATNFTAGHTIRVTAYWGIGWIGVDRATKRVRPDLRVKLRLMLCEIYLQMVSGTGKPSLWFLVRNLGTPGRRYHRRRKSRSNLPSIREACVQRHCLATVPPRNLLHHTIPTALQSCQNLPMGAMSAATRLSSGGRRGKETRLPI